MPPPVQSSNPVFASPLTNPFDLKNVGEYASPTFADIDGDGDLDALVGNAAGELLYFRNIGTATNPLFTASSLTGLPSSEGAYATPTFVDINGDNVLDVVAGKADGTIVYFKNTGTATAPSFAAATTLTGLTSSGISSNAHPTFADIDGDGDLDAFVGNHVGDIFYFENTGSATSPSFTAMSNTTGNSTVFGLPTNPNGTYFAKPTFIDVNGDGKVDVLVGNQNGDILYYKNTTTTNGPEFTYISTNPFGLDKGMPRGKSVSSSLVDINGDGKLDAFVGTSDGDLLLFINEPVSSEQTVAHTTVTGGSTADTTVTEGGATDSFTVVLNGQPSADVTVTLDNTNKQVTTDVNSVTFTSANWNVPQYVTVTAVDNSIGDGAHTGVIKFTTSSSDSAFNGATPANVVVHITDNDIAAHNPTFDVPPTSATGSPFGAITNPNPFGLSNEGSFSIPTFVDINADGKLDAFVGNKAGDTLYFKNIGTASAPIFDTAVNASTLGISSAGSFAAPAFADIDGDGDLDAFVGAGNGGILFFKNSGSASNPSFDAPVDVSTLGLINTGLSAKPTFADLNGDGKLDAIIGVQSGDTLVYLNTGTLSNPEFGSAATNPYSLSNVGGYARPVFMDINGDGKLDALIGDKAGDTYLFFNKGSATSPDFSNTPIPNPLGLSNVGSSATPTFADINADGKPDVFIGNDAGDISFAYNDAIPTITASGSVNFTEAKDAASTAIVINSGLTVTDTDNATLASATVSITTGYQSGEDVLSFSNDGSMGNITGSFNSTTGVETLQSSGNTATLAQWQTALRAVHYVDNSNTPNTTARTISFIVNDGIIDSTAATSTINVAAANDSPTVTVANSAASFTEDASATVLDNTITVSDPELDALGNYNGTTLTLARHGGANAEDVFSSAAFSSGNVVVSSTTIGAVTTNSAGTLVLTFNTSATQALVDSALQQIAYKDSSHTPPASVQLDWTFNDGNTGKQPQGSGGTLSTTASTTVNITAANDPHTGGVTISNTSPQQGDTLTANNTLVDLDGLGTLNYQWKADNSAITGATSNTYKLTQAEVNKAISVTVSYTDNGGTAESADSSATGKVANVNDDPTGTVTVSDNNPYQGETLTATNDIADLDGLGTITYEWFADSTSLTTSDTYTLTPSEAGKVIHVVAHYKDGFSHAESVSSSNTNAVTSVAPAITITPTSLQNTGEDGTTVSYSIVLTTKVSADVVLSFSSSDTTEGTVDTPTLTFTSANWDTAQTLTVRGVDDHLNDGTVAYTVNGAISTTDNNYKVLSITPLQLANLDDGRDVPQNLKGDQGNTKPVYDVLTGIDGDDQLYGYTMSDTLSGGIGNDSLWGGDGNDKLYGGSGDDSLLGEAGADSLVGDCGNDSLDGGAGIDTLDGGAGSDTYYLGYFDRDTINDSGCSFDTDTVYVPYQVTSYTLPSSIENGIIPQGTRTYSTLSAFGTVNAASDTLTGNASCNVLIGNEGKNLLNGDLGNDTLEGSAGNDTLNGGNGNDLLGGESAFARSCIISNDVINGGLGNDIISSGLGNDTVTGGLGIDSFMLIDALNTTATPNIDTITDFTSGSDVIMLSRAIFTAYPPTTSLNLNADMTFTGGTRVGLSVNLLYNANSGVLSYDSDGAGPASPVALAILGSNTHPANLGHDFVVFDNIK